MMYACDLGLSPFVHDYIIHNNSIVLIVINMSIMSTRDGHKISLAQAIIALFDYPQLSISNAPFKSFNPSIELKN